MFKITFMGAGSVVFTKNVIGDCILTPELGEFDVALYDIDEERVTVSYELIVALNKKYNGKARIKKYLGVKNRKNALRGADFVINAIQVGGYEPSTVIDFEIPKKYGLRQTIADTLGIGGIFRALRTFPVLDDFASDILSVAPKALFLNYTNPMAMLSSYLEDYLKLNAIGLCHSVQVCVPRLLKKLGFDSDASNNYKIAGINHQAWLLEIYDKDGNDMYPEIKRRSLLPEYREAIKGDLVRMKMMNTFGYYITESSEHTAEYVPYFIKSAYPELIGEYNVPLDEYPRRCIKHNEIWAERKTMLSSDEAALTHEKSKEYACRIINAIINDNKEKIHCNVRNTGLITNLPEKACVEVPCLIDASGIAPCRIGELPEQLAALNRTNINTQILTVKAGITRRKEDVYRAALLDPHTSSELPIDKIISLCDDLFAAHGEFLPEYK